MKKETKKNCRDPGLFRARTNSPDLNQGPSDLQSDALPTELSRQSMTSPGFVKKEEHVYYGQAGNLKVPERGLEKIFGFNPLKCHFLGF